MSEDSKENLDAIALKIKSYIENNKDIKVKIIGHASYATDDRNEMSVDSDVYANVIQNWFRDYQDTNQTILKSKKFADDIALKLLDYNISKDIMVVEYRGSKDLAYSTGVDKELSNRVMVSIYVIEKEKKETLKEIDSISKKTKKVKISIVDKDKDGVEDMVDECLNTPIGMSVLKNGCPKDSDNDGVIDNDDDCPETEMGLSIDENGCEIVKKLNINFVPLSSEIMSESASEIREFANFLKANPTINVEIVGHTDSVGRKDKNMILSFDRSNAVKAALVKEGIKESRIIASGRGELDPLETNLTVDGRKRNRRIEVKLLK
jgi:outer membrane protein OmpA-like peptidoglycan-associated protein